MERHLDGILYLLVCYYGVHEKIVWLHNPHEKIPI